MMTQSHFLISGFIAHRLRRWNMELRLPAVLLGSIAPDIPLTLLTLWFYFVPLGGLASTHDELFGPLYDQYFFEEPFWIVSHNTLHGPLLFFPLAWSYRFPAPVSYWDPSHGGAVFSRVEWSLDLAIIGYFLVFWLRKARRRGEARPATSSSS